MPRRFGTIVLLCEDMQQRCFVWRHLQHKPMSWHDIRVVVAPKGKGAAEQHIRTRYATEVKAMRARLHAAPGLITVIDADTFPVEHRLRQLDNSLVEAAQQPRNALEPIALLIPKRNIETWIHHLLGQSVNEDDQYPKFSDEQRKCEPAARAFAERCPNNMENAPPSLQAGCTELTRFLA